MLNPEDNPMNPSRQRHAWGSSLLLAGMVVPATTVGASFASSACPTSTPAATEVAPGVCEVVMTESGVFSAPAGIDKLAAVLVGGGGGATIIATGYAGGGGEVTYVDSVDVESPVAVTIGSGGTGTLQGSNATNGGDTDVNSDRARGGIAGAYTQGGASGNGNLGHQSFGDSPGGGASGAATEFEGGPGYLLSEIPGVDPVLFPASANPLTAFGQGGASAIESGPVGSGAGGGYNNGVPFDGASGSVIFRFGAVAPTELEDEELAETGANTSAVAAGLLGLGLVATGAALLARPGRIRTRSS